MRPTLALILSSGFNRIQRVIDTAFNSTALWTLAGSGIGTTAIASGILTIVSTSATYTAVPVLKTGQLEPGSYSITYTIGSYVSGGISICSSTAASMASPTDGTERTANGTYTQTLVITQPSYVGLRGTSGVVSSMTIDDFICTRVS